MGISGSSLLDENKSNFIKGRAQDELNAFSALYRQQYSVEYCNKIREEMEENQQRRTQLLKQRDPLKEAEVLYEEHVLFFDESRKWRERYVVVRANYSLECHEGYESFVKGVPARQKLLPTGGVVLTTEEKYMALVDQCFPDANNVKEDFAPPVVGMPGQFPVYLRLPYRRDSYFCFKQEARQTGFIAILNDCIRHQSQDFLKRGTVEVKAFVRALKLHREHKGYYESWDMLIGSDVRVLSNMLMVELLPGLEKELLPKLKAKKTERKRVWFATVEAAYILLQEKLLSGLGALKEECKTSSSQQEVLLRSDMDHISSSKTFLQNKLTAMVTAPAERHCAEQVGHYLASVLEELMGPVSLGFEEARILGANMMEQLCTDFQEGAPKDELKTALSKMSKANLQSCYQRVGELQHQLKELQQRFNFTNTTGLIHSTQIDIQQLMENMAHTFELLLLKALEDNPENWPLSMERAKNRVLKQYDYDSSTIRKRIFHQALIDITLPSMKRSLAPTVKDELPKFEEFIFNDHSPFITVDNVYEDILLQILEREVSKVVKEAVSMKKYNLFSEMTRDHFSQSSIYSLRTPPGSTPGSPAGTLPNRQAQPPSPLMSNGSEGSPCSSGPCSPLVERGPRAEADAQPSPTTAPVVVPTPVPASVPTPVPASAQPEVAVVTPEPVQAVTVVEPPAEGGDSASQMASDAAAVSGEQVASDAPSAVEEPAEVVAATIGADAAVASVAKETVEAEAPLSPVVLSETPADQSQAAEEKTATDADGDDATTIATQTSFDFPGVPATLSAPVIQASPQAPGPEAPKEGEVMSEPPSQMLVSGETPVPESPAPTEACVDLPTTEEPAASADGDTDTAVTTVKTDAEEGDADQPVVTQETVAMATSADATEGEDKSTAVANGEPISADDAEKAVAPDSSDLSLTSDPTVEVTPAPSQAQPEVDVAEVSADPETVAVSPCTGLLPPEAQLELVEVEVIEECDLEPQAAEVELEASVDEVPAAETSEAPAAEVSEVELAVDDGEAAVDPSDTEEATKAQVEGEVEEKSVDVEPNAGADAKVEAGTADLVSAEVEESVDVNVEESCAEETVVDAEAEAESTPELQTTDQPTITAAAVEEPSAQQPDTQASSSPKASAEVPSDGESGDEGPMGSIKAIRDLIVEVIEVEEPVQHYPKSPTA
ncbi:protein Niban 1a [Engraulis encrasicolus]|uniref:protein Niban 1a n=1 Tax=Engraulis encrasicolus TaxID=184585 RepID=UPI002FD092EB